MATEILMPRQGQSVETCIIVKWNVAVGDTVNEGQTVCEVETDKATFEVPATANGTILALLFPDGAEVAVLNRIAYIGEPGEKLPDQALPAESETPAAAATEAHPSPAKTSAVATPSAAPTPSAEPTKDADPAKQQSTPTPNGEAAAFVSPRARQTAARLGINASALSGSGPGGRVIEQDVLAAQASGQATAPAAAMSTTTAAKAVPVAASATAASATAVSAAAASAAWTDSYRDEPVKGIRKLIAERMLASLRETAQLTLHGSAQAQALLDYRKQLKAAGDPAAQITINDLVMFAVSRVLTKHPALNCHMLGDAVRYFDEVHLGFAVDTPKGLMVPVIRHAQRLTLSAMAQEAKRLAQACIGGKITPQEMSGGTFTVTNLGNAGIEMFTPVLNPPQAAILGVCAIQPKAVNGAAGVEFVQSIGLSLTIDHRIVDGSPAARFMQELSTAIAAFTVTLAQ